MKNPLAPLRPYQILATVLGLNLLFVCGAAIAQRTTDPISWWNRNEDLIMIIDQVHGVLFMGLLILIFVLATRNRWQPGQTILTMLLATVPFVSFWAERRTTRIVLAQNAQPAVAPGD